jgi:hypothetical protein
VSNDRHPTTADTRYCISLDYGSTAGRYCLSGKATGRAHALDGRYFRGTPSGSKEGHATLQVSTLRMVWWVPMTLSIRHRHGQRVGRDQYDIYIYICSFLSESSSPPCHIMCTCSRLQQQQQQQQQRGNPSHSFWYPAHHPVRGLPSMAMDHTIPPEEVA